MKLKTRKQAVAHRLCIGCGLCSSNPNVKMVYSKGIVLPDKMVDDEIIESSCPAKGYDMKGLGRDLFGEVTYTHELGYYRSIVLAHTSDESLKSKAASGGVMGQLAVSLLEKHFVDGVITNRFVFQGNLVRTETYIATTKEEIIAGQGSKYCPTSTLSIISKLDVSKKYLLIGTPCQIAGFRLYTKHNELIKKQIPYTIANFCGGYRDFRELDFFVKDVAHISEVSEFRHRGGGQPGSMRIEGKHGEVFQYPYPEYAKISPFVKNERCTLCMDATGELADFSCGDAWLKNRDKTTPWSIVIARSKDANTLLNNLLLEGSLVQGDEIGVEQVIESQKSNITSKKYRQYKRIRVRDFLIMYSPNWCEIYTDKGGSFIDNIRDSVPRDIHRWR